jgi:beta-galactosidase
LFSDWTPRDLEPHDETVEVYSNCEQVELLLNGKSLGTLPLHGDASPRTWKIHFAPGYLKALGKNKGQIVARHDLHTAGTRAKIVLTSDCEELSPDWNDVAFLRAAVTDKNGVVVPDADDLIQFKISGPGVVAAVDNGDNASHEPFQANARRAFQGTCVAIVKAKPAGGRIMITASAEGLKSGRAVIEIRGK